MSYKSGKPETLPTSRYDRSVTELRYLFLAAQREGARMLSQALAPTGLTPSQAEILGVLGEHEELSLMELGRLIVCETGSPSRIVDTLVNRGLVARRPAAEDRRRVDLSLTESGRQLLPTVRAAEAAIDAIVRDRLSAAQARAGVALVRQLLEGTSSGEALARRFR